MIYTPFKKHCILEDDSYSGVYLFPEHSAYAKVLSEVKRKRGNNLGFVGSKEGVAEAYRIARAYRRLADSGVYPEDTLFLVAKDMHGVVTLMSYMPRLEICEQMFISGEMWGVRSRAAEVLGVHVDDLSGDTICGFNYGLLNGRIYYHDMHVMPFDKMVDERYRDFPSGSSQ